MKFPAIILMETQISQNIGSVARAMLNFGLTDLRLVNPQCDWRDKDAHVLASGATQVLEQARRYDTLGEAISDLRQVYATTARPRDMHKPVYTPVEAMAELQKHDYEEGDQIGFLFGREKSGLENEHISQCDAIVSYPVLPQFASLNLGQSVLVAAYQWAVSFGGEAMAPEAKTPPVAEKEVLQNFFDHLEGELDASGFLRVPHMREVMVHNIRNMFHRASLTAQEVQTLHGIISFLSKMPPENRVRKSHKEREG